MVHTSTLHYTPSARCPVQSCENRLAYKGQWLNFRANVTCPCLKWINWSHLFGEICPVMQRRNVNSPPFIKPSLPCVFMGSLSWCGKFFLLCYEALIYWMLCINEATLQPVKYIVFSLEGQVRIILARCTGLMFFISMNCALHWLQINETQLLVFHVWYIALF